MIGFCKKYDKTVISEADCVFCDSVDLTCCRYWREYEEAEPIKNLKNYLDTRIQYYMEKQDSSHFWNTIEELKDLRRRL